MLRRKARLTPKLSTLTIAIPTITAVAATATLRRAQGPIASNMTITIIAGAANMAAVANRAMFTT